MTLMLLFAIALGPSGVAQKKIDAGAGQLVSFENSDARPHELYSPDCAAMSSPILKPGESFSFYAPQGRRQCHFQDLLDPAAEQYSGELQVTQLPGSEDDAQAALAHVAG